ncbi:popld [Cordyceps fumosorosea ARSEF 2679]|uniref:Popld n=1 Tax=Cordyceps fumosorosea (strain ARSEF 2679) TaxID=1081104 RepID=A0A167NJW2_CORFA|nr:popld [Cordyceps fumosorosea ARSEF 2679]OAA55627.1 popld [Cordyceps fumosorosea ARSEF 2679]
MGAKQPPSGPGRPVSGKNTPNAASSSGGRNDNRRVKVQVARSIPVEPAQSALRDGELDLQAFVAAHEFEVRALEQGMATSKAVRSSQADHDARAPAGRDGEAAAAPRGEDPAAKGDGRQGRRRREGQGGTASQDSKKSTQRTPEAARAVPKTTDAQDLAADASLARQAREDDRPEQPPVAGERGTLVWDTSYMSTIGVYGHEAGLCRVLKRIGFTDDAYWNNKGKKWRAGTRSRSAVISRDRKGRPRPMCPCTVVWNPEPVVQDENKTQRQLFLRMHPSAFKEVFDELLRLIKMETPRLYIEDLRFEIGSIELTGPASTEALLAVLTPHPAAEGSSRNQGAVFQSLHGLTNPSSLTANATLAFTVQDPRLRYPPRRLEGWDDDRLQEKLMESITSWPVDCELDRNLLFDRNARHRASGLPTQQAIYKRRSGTTPGGLIEPGTGDPEIPITLLAARSSSATQTQGSWTLMLPWKCVLPVWHSLVHCPLISGGNPRFAGVDEAMQVAFERGVPWFPADYPGTDAGAGWELAQRAKRRKDYDRRPKSKRTEWASLDLGIGRKGEVGDGLACDFELLFSLKPEGGNDKGAAGPEGDAMEGVEMTVQAPSPPRDVDCLGLLNQFSRADMQAHLTSTMLQPLPDNAIASVRITMLGRGVAKSCARIYRLPRPCTAAPEPSSVQVPSTVPDGATETPHALPSKLRAQWLAKMPTESPASKKAPCRSDEMYMHHRKRLLAQTLTAPPGTAAAAEATSNHPLVPDAADLVGFVTSGAYNMARGRGTAVGAVSVEKVLLDLRATPKEARLCIVRNAGENVGWLARWEHG